MTSFSFTSKSGMCSQCIAFGRRYYIQDRLIGGRDYEYALMSIPFGECKTLKFPDKYKLASWLVESDMDDDIAVSLIIGQHTMCEYSYISLLEKDGKMYVMKKKDLELREYIVPTQETGWFSTYAECLNMSKEILNEMKNKINGEQLTFF